MQIKKLITKEHLSHYLNAYCMWWYCGSELEVNVSGTVMQLDDHKTSYEHQGTSHKFADWMLKLLVFCGKKIFQ